MPTAHEHSITVAIEGVKGSKGVLRLTVFDKEEGFPGDSQKALRLISVPAKAGKLEVVIDKLPAGKYAVALLHDENENGELDTNLVGYPKEGYGASNNQLPTFRAPSFAEAAFQVPLADEALPILIRY
ncbi:MAG: DUF2141 domain-containing protein [Bacteroidetes bacterium]|nr:DUF2141 domain-containing protein [Bacteroidota bacterium]